MKINAELSEELIKKIRKKYKQEKKSKLKSIKLLVNHINTCNIYSYYEIFRGMFQDSFEKKCYFDKIELNLLRKH